MRNYRRTVAVAALGSLCLPLAISAQAAETVLPEVTVTGTREAELKSETPASVGVVGGDEIGSTRPAHPTEIMGRIPGVVVQPTNGEGHVTGIRQPIGTNPVYLFLEDGVPTRSTGFFNHNGLYETNIPQAGGLEVLKGPGSALHGSDAMGGVINVLTRAPSLEPELEGTFEAGSFGWLRGLASASGTWGDDGVRLDANLTHTDGWRKATAYDRRSGTLRWDRAIDDNSLLKTVLSFSDIDQETAGTSRLSRNDYERNPTENYTPISYRKVRAARLSAAYEREEGPALLSLTPYVRWNEMDMMPNWLLSSDPQVSLTGHSSLGLLAKYRHDFAPWRSRLVLGTDLDYSPGKYREHRISTTKTGDVYTSYARGEKSYDFDATYMAASPYVHAEASPVENLRVQAGLRMDAMRYDYENNMTVLQTGSRRRPGSTSVSYLHFSPKLGATYAVNPALNVFANWRHAFRAPGATQLFRQGSSVSTTDLRPVKADSVEIGFRGREGAKIDWELAGYWMVKKDDILTYRAPDNTRTTTNAGSTTHRGVEAAFGWRFLPEWRFDASASLSEHIYDDWKPSATSDYADKEMSSAPRTTANLRLGYAPMAVPGLKLELEMVHMGRYWMDDENSHRYPGHEIFHLRGEWQIHENFKLFARVMNIFDSRYAALSSYNASRGEELAPGEPLSVFGGIQVKF